MDPPPDLTNFLALQAFNEGYGPGNMLDNREISMNE
jgi:hypothetical protein